MRPDQLTPLAFTTRGAADPPLIESIHLGALALCDGRGRLLAALGDPDLPVHLRSTAKPFQLLPLLLDGIHRRPLAAREAFNRPSSASYTIDDADLALMMASHSGQPMHTGRVKRLLDFAGLTPEDLLCGAHMPVHKATADTLIAGLQAPSALHNNCSGKHTGMLIVCRHHDLPTATYLDPAHPLQQRILRILSALSGASAVQIGHAIDGCSAPTFVLPLQRLAAAFARLGNPGLVPDLDGHDPAEALGDLWRAATTHPQMVAGDQRLDTALMRALPGQLLAKIGAAGAYTLSLRPSERFPYGLGLALKIADGDPAAELRPIVVAALLRQLGVLSDPLPGELAALLDPVLTNHRGLPIGSRQVVPSLFAALAL